MSPHCRQLLLHEGMQGVDVAFLVKPSRHARLVGDNEDKPSFIIGQPDGFARARHPFEFALFVQVAFFHVQHAVTVEKQSRALETRGKFGA